MPAAGPGEVLIRVAASGINRPDVLQRKGLYPVPPGASDIPGLEVAGTIVEGDAEAMRAAGFAGRRPGLRAGRRRRLRGVLRRAGRPVPAVAGEPQRHRGGEPARDLLHRLVERLRSRPPAAGRDAADPGRQQRHRRDRDPDGQGARRDRHRHRRLRREGGRLQGARRRPRDQLQDAGLRRRGEADHRPRPASTSSSTWSPAATSSARSRCLAAGRPPGDHRGAGRHRREGRCRPGPAQSPHRHRLDPAAAAGRVQERDRRGAEAHGLAVARERHGQAGDPRGVPGRRGGARRTR